MKQLTVLQLDPLQWRVLIVRHYTQSVADTVLLHIFGGKPSTLPASSAVHIRSKQTVCEQLCVNCMWPASICCKLVNMCTAPERRVTKEWFDTAALSPPTNSKEPRLFASPPSDVRESYGVAGVSHKSPARSSSSLLSSPAMRGSRLQQLENYENSHGRQQSPRKLSPARQSSPSESSSSDVNSGGTPTSHRLNIKLAPVCLSFFVCCAHRTISNLILRNWYDSLASSSTSNELARQFLMLSTALSEVLAMIGWPLVKCDFFQNHWSRFSWILLLRTVTHVHYFDLFCRQTMSCISVRLFVNAAEHLGQQTMHFLCTERIITMQLHVMKGTVLWRQFCPSVCLSVC